MESENKSDWLYRQLHQRVMRMRDQEAFPTVRQLMAEYGLSLVTVTAAVRRLKEKGLVESFVGRGSFVRRERQACFHVLMLQPNWESAYLDRNRDMLIEAVRQFPMELEVCRYDYRVDIFASTEKAELYASEVELRQDITDLLSARRALRQSRRNRKTRYRAPRFNNRLCTKRKGWLAPSVENRINAHLSRIETVLRMLPVTKITVETASFDMQLLKDPDISGKEYQEGEQLGFWNVRECVLFRDGHVCQHCHGRLKDPVLNVHHLKSRRTGGDSPGNLITLCETCHKALHRGEITLKAKRGQSFRAETFMGIMRREVLDRLKASHPKLEVQNTYGYWTKHARMLSASPAILAPKG